MQRNFPNQFDTRHNMSRVEKIAIAIGRLPLRNSGVLFHGWSRGGVGL